MSRLQGGLGTSARAKARTEHPGVNSYRVVDVDPPHDGHPLLWGTIVWIYTFVTTSNKRVAVTSNAYTSFGCNQMDAERAAQIYGRRIMMIVHFRLRASGDSGMERYPKRTGPFGPLAVLAGPLSGNCHLSLVCSATGSRGTTAWHYRTMPEIAMEQGMMIAGVNIAIGAIDRILKTTKHGRSNNRELTNARAELDHWRARLLKAVHEGMPEHAQQGGVR